MDDLNETFKQLKTPKDSQNLLSAQKNFQRGAKFSCWRKWTLTVCYSPFLFRVNQHNDHSFFFSQTGQTVIHIIKLSRVCSRLQIPGFPLTVDYYLTKIPLGFFWSELHI